MNKKNIINKKEEKSEIEILKKQVEENLGGWKRAKADYENLKKRTADEKKKISEFVNAEMILNLLPIVDNFASAYKNIPAEIQDNNWVRGIGFIKDQFDKFFLDNEVEAIKSLGEDFDPEMHEAIESVKNKAESGKIIEEIQTGYKFKDKVIRPARVKVAK